MMGADPPKILDELDEDTSATFLSQTDVPQVGGRNTAQLGDDSDPSETISEVEEDVEFEIIDESGTLSADDLEHLKAQFMVMKNELKEADKEIADLSVSVDFNQAAHFYSQALALGHLSAFHRLAALNIHGLGK